MLARLEKRGESYEAAVVRAPGKRGRAGAHPGRVARNRHGFRVLPVDRKARGEYALDKRDAGGAKNNELVLCEPLGRKAAGFPRVRVVERIGSMDSPRTISLIAIHAHGIPDRLSAKRAGRSQGGASPSTRAGRTDLRAIPLVTIDPEDARDHDDAVWAGADDDPANKGGHVVLVAIADVAHYVTPGSALDKEALKRGNSAYFPDRVVPMLPEELSADLCSLEGRRGPPLPGGAHGVRRAGAQARPQIPARRDAVGGAADLCPGAGGLRRQARCRDERVGAQDAGRSVGRLQNARHRAGKAQSRWISTCRNGASCWARTAMSPPSPIASGWNPCG